MIGATSSTSRSSFAVLNDLIFSGLGDCASDVGMLVPTTLSCVSPIFLRSASVMSSVFKVTLIYFVAEGATAGSGVSNSG